MIFIWPGGSYKKLFKDLKDGELLILAENAVGRSDSESLRAVFNAVHEKVFDFRGINFNDMGTLYAKKEFDRLMSLHTFLTLFGGVLSALPTVPMTRSQSSSFKVASFSKEYSDLLEAVDSRGLSMVTLTRLAVLSSRVGKLVIVRLARHGPTTRGVICRGQKSSGRKLTPHLVGEVITRMMKSGSVCVDTNSPHLLLLTPLGLSVYRDFFEGV